MDIPDYDVNIYDTKLYADELWRLSIVRQKCQSDSFLSPSGSDAGVL